MLVSLNGLGTSRFYAKRKIVFFYPSKVALPLCIFLSLFYSSVCYKNCILTYHGYFQTCTADGYNLLMKHVRHSYFRLVFLLQYNLLTYPGVRSSDSLFLSLGRVQCECCQGLDILQYAEPLLWYQVPGVQLCLPDQGEHWFYLHAEGCITVFVAFHVCAASSDYLVAVTSEGGKMTPAKTSDFAFYVLER